jgi:hypothetical protein
MSHVGRFAGARRIKPGRFPDAASRAPALAGTDVWVLLGLVLVVIAYRVLTTPMIETGGDAAVKWYYAKTWLAELAGGHIRNHHAARFSINTLTAAFQSVFGTHLLVYYMPAFSMSVAQVVFVYLLCRRAAGVWAAVLACPLVILHPLLVRNGAQLLPGIFCGTYVIAALYMLSRNFDPRQGRIETNIVIAAVLIFCAYLSKEPNLFFVPACLLAVWAARRSYKDLGLFMVVLGALGLLEYLYYVLMVEGGWLGRLSTISGHLRAMSDVENLSRDYLGLTWLNLPLRRYAPSRAGGIVPAMAFYTACLSSLYLLLRERRLNTPRAMVAYAFLSYGLIDAYAVTGIDPLTPVQKFHARYMAVLVPLIGVVIVFALSDVGATVARLLKPAAARRGSILQLGVTASLVMVFVYSFHNINRPRYVTNLAEHPFAVLQNYQAVVDDARARCVPFVVQPGKSRRITDRMFSDRFDRLKWQELERSDFEAIGFPEECASRYPDLRAYVDSAGRDGDVAAVLVAVRHPEGRPGLFVERQRLPIDRLIPEG